MHGAVWIEKSDRPAAGQESKGCYATKQGGCRTCEKGFFKAVAGSESCSACPEFSVTLASGSTSLDQCICAQGYFGLGRGASTCQRCPTDRTSQLGSTDLTDCQCAAGFEVAPNDGSCKQCALGEYSLPNSSCTACPPGKFGVSTEAVDERACALCRRGSYQNQTAATFCEQCPAGTYSSSEGATSMSSGCTYCPPGKFQLLSANVEGLDCVDCDACGSGFFREGCQGYDMGWCRQCPAATFKSSYGTSSCTPCPDHSTTTDVGSVSISECECNAGFTGIVGGCIACEEGSYKRDIGSSPCFACPKGSVSPLGSSRFEQCVCSPGYYGTSEECVACPKGFYKSEAGESGCAQCAMNSISPEASISSMDCICNAGFERDENICSPCTHGKYRSISSKVCIQCPPFSTTASDRFQMSENIHA